MKNIALSIVFALGGTAVGLPVLAQQSPVNTISNQSLATSQVQMSDAQLDSLLAPIALYPDTLLTHILIASTYPLDVISADRWRQSNKHLTSEQVEDVLEDVDWDPSVKALAAFSDLLNTMANDLEWLQELGDSVLISQDRVLDRVQVLRQHARNTGNLDTNEYVEVETEQENNREIIYIAPRQREVVYVPYYDPQIVYGSWWHPIAPIFWSHHVNYHRHRNVYWSPQVRISAFFSFGAVHWSNRHVVVYRQPLQRLHRNNKFYRDSQRKRIISNDYQRWEHRVDHRRARYSPRVVQTKPTRFTHQGNRVLSTRHTAGSPSSRSVSKVPSVAKAQLKTATTRRELSSNRSISVNKGNKRSDEKREVMLSRLDANKRHYAKTSNSSQKRQIKDNRYVKPQPIKPQQIKKTVALKNNNAGLHKPTPNKSEIKKARTFRTDSNLGKASQHRASSMTRVDRAPSKQTVTRNSTNKNSKQTVTRNANKSSKQTVTRNVTSTRNVSRNERSRNIQSQNRLSRDR